MLTLLLHQSLSHQGCVFQHSQWGDSCSHSVPWLFSLFENCDAKNTCLYDKLQFIRTSGILSKYMNTDHSLHRKMARMSNAHDLFKSHYMNIMQNIISFMCIFLPVPCRNYCLFCPAVTEHTITVMHLSIFARVLFLDPCANRKTRKSEQMLNSRR